MLSLESSLLYLAHRRVNILEYFKDLKYFLLALTKEGASLAGYYSQGYQNTHAGVGNGSSSYCTSNTNITTNDALKCEILALSVICLEDVSPQIPGFDIN